MGTLMDNNSAETARLLEQARAGDKEAVDALFARHRPRLRRMVDMRLDRRLQARIDVITRTNSYQVRTGDYSDDVISVYLVVRRFWGDRPKVSMHKLADEMAERADDLCTRHVVPKILKPISGKNEMGMCVHESWQHRATACIDDFSIALTKLLDLTRPSDVGNPAISRKQTAVRNDSQVAKFFAESCPGRPRQCDQLRRM